MAELPPPIPHTVALMDQAIVAKAKSFDGAGIPMSDVANECDRAIWMKLRWTSPPERAEGQRERRFRTGHQYETWLLDDLEAAGVEVARVDPSTGKQWRVELASGHIRGKMDGRAIGLPEAPKTEHVVECKSHKAEIYRKIVKAPIRESKPDHYAQCQLYMHAEGLTRCLYLAANKDTDEIHTERVEYDPVYCLALVARLERIVHAPRAPTRLHEDPNAKGAFACQICTRIAQCHEGQFSRVNCRTCLNSEPRENAGWHCVRWDKPLSYREQQAGCPAHRYIPDLVPAEQVDVLDNDVIVYRLADGSEFRDGEGR